MDTPLLNRIFVSIVNILWLAACTGLPATTPYKPPPPAQTRILSFTPTSSRSILDPTPVCINDLVLLEDLTLPDYTIVAPGEILDKQWLVRNSGTCNWGSDYRLLFIGGSLMGASEEQALLPSIAGADGVIRILFTAPLEAGEYYSLWQAYNPQAEAFGEAFFAKVIVQP